MTIRFRGSLDIDMAALTQNKPVASLLALGEGKPARVCFVCTGNTCRSPMAEAVFNHIFRVPEICSACDPDKLLARSVRAISAGLFALGDPIAENAVKALEAAGIPSRPDNDYRGHISQSVNVEIMEECDAVIGLSGSHAMQLMSFFPQYASKITCFPFDIPDPYGGDEEDYALCLAAIRRGIGEMFGIEGEDA